jgi:hypothetical protein
MKNKTGLATDSIATIELLIKECVQKGEYDEAKELAQFINRKLTLQEIDSIAIYHLELTEPRPWHVLGIAEETKVSRSILEKIIQKSTTEGSMWIAYRAAQIAKRKLSQNEVDAIYLAILKKETKPEQFKKEVNDALYYDTMYDVGRKDRVRHIKMDVNPSQEVANQLLEKCLEQNLIDLGFTICWIRRQKDQVKQELIDQLVMRHHASGDRLSVDTPKKEVIMQASLPVIESMLKEFMEKSHDSYSLFYYAECDSTGTIAAIVVDVLLEDAEKIQDKFKKEDALKDLVDKVTNHVYKINYQTSTIEKLVEVNFRSGLWFENLKLAINSKVSQEISDKILMDIKSRQIHYRTLELYRERGGPDEVKQWLIETFSCNYEISSHLKFDPKIVAELGGREAMDALVVKLLKADRVYDAIQAAKLIYLSKDKREEVIAASIKTYGVLHLVEDLLKLNKRKLTQAEIDTMFQSRIEELRSKDYNLHPNADTAIELLKLNPSKELIDSLVVALKEKKLMAKLVQVLVFTGKQIKTS